MLSTIWPERADLLSANSCDNHMVFLVKSSVMPINNTAQPSNMVEKSGCTRNSENRAMAKANKLAAASSPLVNNGVVYYGSYDKYLYAADTSKGTLRWKKSIDNVIETSPVLLDSAGKANYPSISGGSPY